MSEQNKALIRRLYDEGYNRQDAKAAAALYAADAVNHGRTVGRQAMQEVFETLFETYPDFNYRILEATAEDDRVVCKVMMTGTHLGEPTRMNTAFGGMLKGVKPTGRKVEVMQFHSFRVRGGEIVEHSAVRDDLGMLKQLGLAKAPA